MRELTEDEIRVVVGGPQNTAQNPEYPVVQEKSNST